MPLSLNSLSTARCGDCAAAPSLMQMFSLGGEKTASISAPCPTRTRVGDLSKYGQQMKQHKVNDERMAEGTAAENTVYLRSAQDQW